MHERAKELIRQGDNLFEKRGSLVSLWQEMADNFYPERADFTNSRSLGSEFADHLMTSYPVLARRDLGNAFNGMLRPRSKDWFKLAVREENSVDTYGNRWLEYASGVMRKAMYDRKSLFTRATKEGDHDFATFGQTVVSVEPSRDLTHLLYRCWHLRDVAWCENENGVIDTVYRKWKPSARTLASLFKDVHQSVRDKLEKDPYCEINCMHAVVPSESYAGEKKYKTPFVSLYVDVDNQHVMEEVGSKRLRYVIPRWQTVSGSQYAYSPATIVALPDARLIQSMTLTLLEAGEKAVSPPMIAVKEAIRSDVALYAGGITYTDASYDERLGEVLRPLSTDRSGIPFGIDLRNDVREMISECFYLNKLSLPPQGDMTAFEVSQRIQEYIRQALPIFEPMEQDYNGALCEETFAILFEFGAFGPIENIPRDLLDKNVEFKFESPLHDAIEKEKTQKFTDAANLLAVAVQIDPDAPVNLDSRVAFRDALQGIGVPAAWITPEEEAEEAYAANEQKRQMQSMAQMAAMGAEGVKIGAEADKAVMENENAA